MCNVLLSRPQLNRRSWECWRGSAVLLLLMMVSMTNLVMAQPSEEATPFRGQILRIQNKASSEFLDVLNASQQNGAMIGQWNGAGEKQEWLIEPVPGGGGKVYIVALHSGKLLACGKKERGAIAEQWPYGDPKYLDWGGRAQMWWLEDPDGEGYYKIRNDRSNKYLDLSSKSKQMIVSLEVMKTGLDPVKAKEMGVIQWDDDAADSQRWEIISYRPIEPWPTFSVGKFNLEPPKLTGMGAPANGDWVDVENILVPFFLVKDPDMTIAEQASRSPYYVMKTSKQWVPVAVQPNPDSAAMKVTVMQRTSTATSVSTEVEQSVSSTVTASMSYGILDASAEVSLSALRKNIHQRDDAQENQQTETKMIDGKSTLVFWNDKHKFELKRMRGDLVKSWTKNGRFIVENKFYDVN